MTARYKRVPQQEATEPSLSPDLTDGEKNSSVDFSTRLQIKLTALLWVVGSVSLFIFTDSIGIILHDLRLARWYLNLAVVCFTIDVMIMLYLTLYLPLISKVYTPWEIYCPRMIPTATLCGVIGGISLMIAFWPIWGLLTPLILTIYFLGLVFATHFIPWPC